MKEKNVTTYVYVPDQRKGGEISLESHVICLAPN